MRILHVAGREQSYARNEVMLRALRRFAEVDAIAPERAPRSLMLASASAALRAHWAARFSRYDLIVAGFYGYLIAQSFLFRRTPLLLDAFVSNYDTLVDDRGTVNRGSAAARVALWLDKSTCARADHILIDTEVHAGYFADFLGVERAKITALPVGCSEDLFLPSAVPVAADGSTRVLYYCTYLPLHGVDVVLKAAGMVKELPMEIRVVGDGPLRHEMERLAREMGLANVAFLPPMPPVEIAEELRQAHVCLGGHFGAGAKAQRTVPGKIYQMLAANRPVVGGDSPANRQLLVHEHSALLVPAEDPAALADALRRLHGSAELRSRLATAGRAAFLENASEALITERLRQVVEALVHS